MKGAESLSRFAASGRMGARITEFRKVGVSSSPDRATGSVEAGHGR